MRKIFFIFILVLSLFLVSSISEEKINEDVYDALKEVGKEEVPVIIKVNTGGKFFKKNIEETRKEILEDLEKKEKVREYKELISVEVSEQELKALERNPYVKEVSFSHQIKAFLQDSVPLVNATNVWPIQISGINITGDETVCVIDTGVNFTHPDLIGKNKTCVIDCYNKNCVENCSIEDDNGHGTHVAGIVAANGGIEGVAPSVSLIGLKVLNSTGEGSATSGIDLTNAIDWCIENSETYNISVITMSLGTSVLYNSYCDSSYPTWADSINNATFYNISVIAATGNNGNFTHIASPSCIENVTAVGWSNKGDTINTNSNRNNITDLVAPGTNINSTEYVGAPICSEPGVTCSGEYAVMSGTSMAAPHVAGAFALVRQFFKLQNLSILSPEEIQSSLKNTGVLITDSNSNFSRIDVFSAIISLDNQVPKVNLISPSDEHLSSTNQQFKCNATDSVQLKNITLQIWDSEGLYFNATNKTSNRFLEVEFNVSLAKGNYKWNCLVYDANDNYNSSSNFSLYVENISVSLTEPSNNKFVTQNETNFTCLSQTASSFDLTNVTLFLWNSTELVYNITEDISGTSNVSVFWYNFTQEATYLWNCLAYNNVSQSSYADSNFTITYDITGPIISDVSSSVTTSSATISWTSNEEANSSVNYGINSSVLGSYRSNISLTTSHSISLSSLDPSTTYYYNVSSCDRAGNCQVNGTYSFTTSSTTTTAATGGGGGTTTTYKTYIPTVEQVSRGYTKELGKNDKIKFTFFIKTEQHILTVKEIGKDYVNLTIYSEPINLILGIGQSTKLNLTSAEYYDLYIKLEAIVNNKAKLTIQTIYEPIQKPKITGKVIEEKREEEKKERPEKEKENYPLYFIVISVIMILFVAVLIHIIEKKFQKEKIKEIVKRYGEKKAKKKKGKKNKIGKKN